MRRSARAFAVMDVDKLKISSFARFVRMGYYTNEPRHKISNNVLCATSKASDQPAHTRSLIRDFASRMIIL